MLTPEQLANCADELVRLYSQLDESIVRDIARRIAKSGTITESGKWQINALQDVGMLHTDIVSSIAKFSGKSESSLKQLFEDASLTAVEYDMSIYTKAGLKPLPLNMSPSAMQVLEAGYKKTNGNIKNLTNTTAITSQTAFINACSIAELQVSSGAFDYNTAISRAIESIAKNMPSVLYPGGHTDKLDVAVRRNVMTGLGQTTGQICLGYAQDMNWDLMEITAHCGARPSHAQWQGQIVSLSGRKGYLTLNDIGYGSGDGFKGWNCRHDWFPYFEGSRRMYSKKELEELDRKNIEYPDGSMHTYYEAEQKQRAYERKIRETKRILAVQDEVMKTTSSEGLKMTLQINFDNYSVKLKRQEAEMKNFCKKTGLLPDTARVQKYGFSRSTAQKAVSSANRHYKNWSSGHNINNIKTLAEYYNVKYNDSERYTLLKIYVGSIDKGKLSPLVGFDLYEEYYNRVNNEIVGLTTASGLKIKSQSVHFLERLFGTKKDPQKQKPRSGVKLEDIKDALLSDSCPKYSSKNDSFVFINNKCQVSVNPQGNLTQTNPKGGQKKSD